MKQPTDIGRNRTGIASAPKLADQSLQAAESIGTREKEHSVEPLKSARASFSKNAPPVGTMPPPASLKGAAKTAIDALKGDDANVFLDQLGERLAFERTGVRLYEALLIKFDAADRSSSEPRREELEQIRQEELAHMALLKKSIEILGGDPTAMTPSADVAGVAGAGLLQVLADPRTTFTEGLKAILIAELTDHDSWLLLADLADGLGQPKLAHAFQQALSEEERHLAQVRQWLTHTVQGQAGLEPHEIRIGKEAAVT